MRDGQGNFLRQPSYQAGQPETVLGRPVVEAVDMPDIAADAEPIAFGDFRRGYRIYDRLMLGVLADPYSQRANGLMRYHARCRTLVPVLCARMLSATPRSPVAEKAQLAFNFNDAIDPRLLKRAPVEELRGIVDDKGIEAEERDLRRSIDLAAMMEPQKLKEAIKMAQARNVRTDASEPVPEHYFGPNGLSEAEKSAYGVFPNRLNKEERDFAAFLDADRNGTVKWWMRNPEKETWATRLILPSGHRFFPDFVVGVSGRTTPDAIALVEIKDDGETGRLQSDRNVEKIRVQHREYRNVFWTYRSDGTWIRARYAEALYQRA